MKRMLLTVVLTLWCGTAFAAPEKYHPAAGPEAAVGRYLVTLGELAAGDLVALSTRLAAQYGGRVEPYAEDGFRGFLISMTPARARLLSDDPRVAVVDEQPTSPAVTPVIAPPASAAQALRAMPNAGNGALVIGSYRYDGRGNMSAITGTAGAESYVYDPFGRVSRGSMGTAGLWQEYVYDRYGNLKTIRTQGAAERRLGVNAESNRIDLPTVGGTTSNVVGGYDASGNQTSLSWTDPGLNATFVFDGVGMVRESTVSGARRVYLYTPNDERIATFDAVTGVQQWSAREFSGQVMRRFTRQGSTGALQWSEDYVYRGAEMLASYVSGPEKVTHYFPDHAGSPRLITGAGGAKISDHRYYPFGEEITARDQDAEMKKFTGHERDSIPGLSAADIDYMHARYYGVSQGRFFSIDAAPGKPGLPQSWNRYTYARNNPVNRIDPDGQRDARLYGAIYDVEPGDVVLLVGREDGIPKHVVIVGGFRGGACCEYPDAMIYENSPITEQGKRTLMDPPTAMKIPSLTNSNDPNAGAGIWNAQKVRVYGIARNINIAGIFSGMNYSEKDLATAVTSAGPFCYNFNPSDSPGPQTDCAGFITQVLAQLPLFSLRGGHGITEWSDYVQPVEPKKAKKPRRRPAGACVDGPACQ
ncbi:MAG TPA: RHS repeat-associated core domain-containing protein [Thermoanaerobaculia bacterium]